jgi:hypothetical protein
VLAFAIAAQTIAAMRANQSVFERSGYRFA